MQELALAEKNLRVVPGDRVRTVVTVRNDSDIVDVFTLEVHGLERSWYEFSTVSAALFPGDNLASTLIFAPPKNSAATAKSYPFDVKARSRQNPVQVITGRGTLNVGPFYSFESDVNQESVIDASAKYTVGIGNNSNVPLTFALKAEEPGDSLRLSLDAESVTVLSGARGEVGLVVDLIHRPLSGDPRRHDFTVTVSPDNDGAVPEVIAAQMDVRPWIPAPRWVLPAVVVPVVGGIAAGIAVAVWQLS